MDEASIPAMMEKLPDGTRVPFDPVPRFGRVELGDEARQVVRCILAYSDASASDAVREGRLDLRQALAIWALLRDAVSVFDLQLGEEVTPRCLEMLAVIAAKRGGEECPA